MLSLFLLSAKSRSSQVNANASLPKGDATKHGGWESDMTSFSVTSKGKEALKGIEE